MKNINKLKILMLIFISILIFIISFSIGYTNTKSYGSKNVDENKNIEIEKIEETKIKEEININHKIKNDTKNEITINTNNINLNNSTETLFDKFQFGDDIPEWMIEDKNITLQEYTFYPPVITIYSDDDFYKINNVGVNSTLKEVQEAMAEYTEFYSIHTPDVPNAGWYYLNNEDDIIIFDFIEDDLSYVSENVTPESKVVSVSLTNLIFFD